MKEFGFSLKINVIDHLNFIVSIIMETSIDMGPDKQTFLAENCDYFLIHKL